MQDVLSMLTALDRPRLLVRAARIGADEYRRERHLQRVLGYGNLLRPAPALMKLMEEEAVVDQQRITEDASYSLVRHVDILIAMMGEARLLRASRVYRSGVT